MLYPEAFIEWISLNHYYLIKGMGWYVWPDEEKDEVFICKTLAELFEIYGEQ